MQMRVLLVVGAAVGLGASCGEDPTATPADAGTGIALDGGGANGGGANGGGTNGGGSDGGGEADEGGGMVPRLDVAGGPTGDGGDAGEGGDCPCQNVEDGIYVLDNSGGSAEVWFFDPPANTFDRVGAIGCEVPLGWVANSMAIDRQGYAWLNYYQQGTSTARIYRAPLSDLGACEDTGYDNPGGTWWLLGMGYAVTNPDSSCDELFIYRSDRYLEYPNFGPGGAELGQFDESAAAIDLIGATDYPVGELTGTGDGRLFTFAPVDASRAVLVNLDKNTGSEVEHTPLDGLDITNAFAFAFWGGDVYFFTQTSPGSGVSKVTRLDYDGNEGGGLSVYNANTGLHIPGAGVSTCASFVPPG